MSIRRVGLFGGTFNPIHIGHLIIAENALEQLGLDEVIFAPAGIPPHKDDGEIAPAGLRMAMVQAAIADRPGFRASAIDLVNDRPAFTWKLLEQMRDEIPDAELVFLMGADSLVNFETWSRPERILQLARIGLAQRPGHPITDHEWTDIAGLRERVDLFDSPMCDVSATDIRNRVAAGRSIRYLVPEAVRRTIESSALYKGGVEES